jgi:hypothetical protein
LRRGLDVLRRDQDLPLHEESARKYAFTNGGPHLGDIDLQTSSHL